MNPILSRVQSLAGEGRHPESVRALRLSPGKWQVTISVSDYADHREVGQNLPRHAVTVGEPPEGVKMMGIVRFPDVVFELADVSEEAAETWVRETGEVGKAPDMARFDREDGQLSFITKPILWLREPLRSALLKKYGGRNA